METRSRLLWTALLVLIAVGGAGLAVAADRPHNPVQRPELTWAADQQARPWIDAARTSLRGIAADSATVARSGRDALGNLQALNPDAVDEALADGRAAATGIETALADLTATAQQPAAQVERWRLGEITTETLRRIDTAVESAAAIPDQWARVEARAAAVQGLLDSLTRHDAQVFRATTAGRQARWADALTELEAAAPLLAAARQVRDQLAGSGEVETLDDLLGRYAAYDDALRALYAYVNETGQQSGDDFAALEQSVETAQDALPSDNGVLSVIVGEAAAGTIAEALVQIEQARGDILDALDEEADA